MNETAFAIAAASNGDAFVTGRAHDAGVLDEIFTMRLAGNNGDIIWQEKAGGPDHLDDIAYDIVVDSNDDAIVTGISVNADETADFITVKYDGVDGLVLWTRRMPGAVNDQNPAGWLGRTGGDDVIVANRTWQSGVSFDVVLHRYAAADGAVLWEEQYNGAASGADDPKDMILDGAGNVLVVGVSGGDFMTLCFDGVGGDLLWDSFHDGPMGWYDRANSVCTADDGTVLVAGFTDGGESTWDATLVAYDPQNGDEAWSLVYDGADGLTDEAVAVSLSGAGGLYVSGYSYSFASDMDMLALCYEFTATAAPEPWTAQRGLSSYPNPFRQFTSIDFALPAAAWLEATVFDVRGRRVKVLAAGETADSSQPLVWDGTDDAGRPVPAGVYLVQLRSEAGTQRGRVLRLR